MRTMFAALLFLAACDPLAPAPSPPATQAPAPQSPPSAANADALALQHTPADGAWVEGTHERVVSAGFGAPESEVQFSIECNTRSHALTLTSDHELAPDQTTTLRLITPTQTLELAARSHNEGLPSIVADIASGAPEKTPLISMLGAPVDRFAVDAGGQITVFPWSDAIARTLIACR